MKYILWTSVLLYDKLRESRSLTRQLNKGGAQMENELLEKGLAEVRRVKAIWENTGSGLKSVQSRATLDQALDEAKCKLAMAVVLNGGANWIVEPFFPGNIRLTKIVRGLGGLDVGSSEVYSHGHSAREPLIILWNLLPDEAASVEVATVLTELRVKFGDPLRTCDNMIAICGRFFRFVDGKYEVME